MKPLSKEASAALSALKASDPTAADEARVRGGLESALGVAIPAATVGLATGAASAHAAGAGASASGGLTAMGVGAKVMAFVIAVGVGTAGTVSLTRSLTSRGGEASRSPARVAPKELEITVEAEPARPEPVVPATVEEAVTAPVVPEVVAPRPDVQIAPVPVAIRARPQVAVATPSPAEVAPESSPLEGKGLAAAATPEVLTPPPPPPSEATYEADVEMNFPNCDSGTEMRSAMSARKLLNANRAEEAVWLLGAYQRRCPSGRWSDEAWSVRMAGLCKLGRDAEVTGLLQWFSTEYPERRFAVLTELKKWCPEEVLKHAVVSPE